MPRSPTKALLVKAASSLRRCQGTTRFDARWHFASLVSSSSTISQRPTPSAATPGQSGASRRVLLGPDGRLGTPVGSEADEQSVNFAPDS
ncbi:unnamed protein product [Lampetra fluviatilis]